MHNSKRHVEIVSCSSNPNACLLKIIQKVFDGEQGAKMKVVDMRLVMKEETDKKIEDLVFAIDCGDMSQPVEIATGILPVAMVMAQNVLRVPN